MEKKELDDKIKKLLAFMDGEIFRKLPMDERERMRRQLQYMENYSDVLDERIDNFQP